MSSPSSPPDSASSSASRLDLTRLPASFPDDPTHPLQIALRTYALALALSLGPSLTSLLPSSPRRSRLDRLKKLLKRELGPTGFAFAITLAVGGGAALQRGWALLETEAHQEQPWDFYGTFTPPNSVPDSANDFSSKLKARLTALAQRLTPSYRAFAANLLSSSAAILLLQAGHRRPASAARGIPDGVPIPMTVPLPTLDLTLLLLVRAADALVQAAVSRRSAEGMGNEECEEMQRKQKRRRQKMTTRIDALVFWACSARIMWCFFYEPERLPRSYVKWITSLANVDKRLLRALRAIRAGDWSYIRGTSTPPSHLTSFAQDLGYPPSWGDSALLPAYGGAAADIAWKALGVHGRKGVGGLPCEVVHGGVTKGWGVGDGCAANAGVRAVYAFLEAVAIYLPAHFLPVLLTRPHSILRLRRLLPTFLGALRSALFLSTFVSSYWFSVCLTRTLVLARLLPRVAHDFWDGPSGCMLVGSLVCGGSIWIENGRRRGEMALYVLPRAIRACLPESLMRSGKRTIARWAERLVFVFSLSLLLTAATHRPNSLRGLSRWTCAFVMNGPNAGFWKRRRQSTSGLQTPAEPANGDATGALLSDKGASSSTSHT